MRPSDINPEPFKTDVPPSPLRSLLYMGSNCAYVRIDPAHTYAIDGIGKSYLASGIILLMKLGVFGLGSGDALLENAYARFMAYCDAYGKSTTIYEFSYKTLKLPQGSLLVCNEFRCPELQTKSESIPSRAAERTRCSCGWILACLGSSTSGQR